MSRFRENFLRNNNSLNFPRALKLQLEENLPKGYEYYPIDRNSGLLHLKKKDKRVNTEIELILRGLPKKIQGIEVTPENFWDVLYVTQESIDIGDEDIAIDKIPYGKAKNFLIKKLTGDDNSKLLIIPPSFPNIAVPLRIDFAGEEISFKMQRVAYPSLSKAKFVNTNYLFFTLELILNYDNDKMELTFNFDLSKIDTVKEVIEFKNVIIAFFKREIKFKNLIKTNMSPKIKKAEDIVELIDIYERIYELEKLCNVSFKNEYPFNKSQLALFRKLYCSVVKGKWLIFGEVSGKSLTMEGSEPPIEMKEYFEAGKHFVLKSEEDFEEDLFGEKIEFQEITLTENLMIESIVENKNKWIVKCKIDEGGRRLKFFVIDGVNKEKIITKNDELIEFSSSDW